MSGRGEHRRLAPNLNSGIWPGLGHGSYRTVGKDGCSFDPVRVGASVGLAEGLHVKASLTSKECLEFVVQSISGEADRADRPDEFFGIEVVSEDRMF